MIVLCLCAIFSSSVSRFVCFALALCGSVCTQCQQPNGHTHTHATKHTKAANTAYKQYKQRKRVLPYHIQKSCTQNSTSTTMATRKNPRWGFFCCCCCCSYLCAERARIVCRGTRRLVRLLLPGLRVCACFIVIGSIFSLVSAWPLFAWQRTTHITTDRDRLNANFGDFRFRNKRNRWWAEHWLGKMLNFPFDKGKIAGKIANAQKNYFRAKKTASRIIIYYAVLLDSYLSINMLLGHEAQRR